MFFFCCFCFFFFFFFWPDSSLTLVLLSQTIYPIPSLFTFLKFSEYFGYCINTLHRYSYLMGFLLLSEATLSSVENVCSGSIVLSSNHGSLTYSIMTLGDLLFPHFCLTLDILEFELLSPKLQ